MTVVLFDDTEEVLYDGKEVTLVQVPELVREFCSKKLTEVYPGYYIRIDFKGFWYRLPVPFGGNLKRCNARQSEYLNSLTQNIKSCETCVFQRGCQFTTGDNDYCHEYQKE